MPLTKYTFFSLFYLFTISRFLSGDDVKGMISQRDGVTTTEQLRILITKLLQIPFGPCLPADSCHPRMLEMIKHIERSSECQADALLAGSDYIIMHGQGLFQLLQRIIMQSASCDGGYLFQVLFAERAEREISVAGQQGIATLENSSGETNH